MVVTCSTSIHLQINPFITVFLFCAALILPINMLNTSLCIYAIKQTLFQAVQSLIKPDILPDNVRNYLWRHIVQDIDDLRQAVSRSTDDVFLAMHIIVNGILNSRIQG